jgi:hypothetical protein
MNNAVNSIDVHFYFLWSYVEKSESKLISNGLNVLLPWVIERFLLGYVYLIRKTLGLGGCCRRAD